MNRRGTEPYARWCERPGRETSPAYSIPYLDIVRLRYRLRSKV